MLTNLKVRIVAVLTATALMAFPLGAVDSCYPDVDDATPISIPDHL